MRRAPVVAGIHPSQVICIKAPDIAQHMRQQFSVRVVPCQVRHDLNAVVTVTVNGKARHFIL